MDKWPLPPDNRSYAKIDKMMQEYWDNAYSKLIKERAKDRAKEGMFTLS